MRENEVAEQPSKTNQAPTDPEAVKAWYKKTLDGVVGEMLRTGAVSGVAVDAAPIWHVPYQILIAKVWDAQKKSSFIWTIAGEAAVTDHISGSLAASAQEAARHFSLKWQMDANRLREVARTSPDAQTNDAHMQAYTTKLIEQAEALYELACRDDIWKPKHH